MYLHGTPNIEWFQEHNGSSEESHGHYIMTCEDGGFLQIGESNFLPNSKIYIVKTNANGEFLWSREINIGGHNLGNSAIELIAMKVFRFLEKKNSPRFARKRNLILHLLSAPRAKE